MNSPPSLSVAGTGNRYSHDENHDTISAMTRNRTIALAAGAATCIASFIGMMWFLAFGNVVAESHRLLMVSLALGPVAVCAVVLGYSVWWLALFLLTLFLPSEGPVPETTRPRREANPDRELP
jgi:hypothetical protein